MLALAALLCAYTVSSVLLLRSQLPPAHRALVTRALGFGADAVDSEFDAVHRRAFSDCFLLRWSGCGRLVWSSELPDCIVEVPFMPPAHWAIVTRALELSADAVDSESDAVHRRSLPPTPHCRGLMLQWPQVVQWHAAGGDPRLPRPFLSPVSGQAGQCIGCHRDHRRGIVHNGVSSTARPQLAQDIRRRPAKHARPRANNAKIATGAGCNAAWWRSEAALCVSTWRRAITSTACASASRAAKCSETQD